MTNEQYQANLKILDSHYVLAVARRRQDLIREAAEDRAKAQLVRPSAPRDVEIVRLTKLGMSANKIRERLNLDIGKDRVSAIARKHVGPMRRDSNSRLYAIAPAFMPYVKEALRRLGKDPSTCEICGDKPLKGCIVHHTKYEGVTVYDLMYICTSCNLSRENKGLS